MREHLRDQWAKGIRRAGRFSRVARTRIFLTFIIVPIRLLFELPSAFETTFTAAWFIMDTAVFLLALEIFRRYLVRYDDVVSWPNIKQPSPVALAAINEMLSPLAREMEVDASRLTLLVDSTSFSSSPSVIESRGDQQAYMILPLGYLKMLKADPLPARAVMAHELSHIRQRDARLWLLVTAFGRSVLRVFVPYNTIAFVLVAWFLASTAEQHGWSLDAKRTLVLGFAGVILPLLFYSSVTAMRRRSERLADLGAAAFTGVENVRRALVPYAESAESSFQNEAPIKKIFAMHPSARDRMAALDVLERQSPEQPLYRTSSTSRNG